MYVYKLKMRPGCEKSCDVRDIEALYIGYPVTAYWKKERLHDYVRHHPGTVQVAIAPYMDVIPAVSSQGEKYVRSGPDDSPHDSLLRLSREE